MPETLGHLLEGVKLVRIITEEATPKTYAFTTGESMEYTPSVEAGTEVRKRNKNKILATAKTEDLIAGYDLKLALSVLAPEAYALIDGGTLTGTGSTAAYSGPAVGVPTERVPFTLEVYTGSMDTDGDVLEYVKFEFPGCKGTPISGVFKDGEFHVPEMTIKSRPKNGESPMDWSVVPALPAL